MTTTVTGAMRNSLRSISELSTVEPEFDGQQAELLGHTVAGIGGGNATLTSTDTIRFGASTGNKVFAANQHGQVVKVADTVWRIYQYD